MNPGRWILGAALAVAFVAVVAASVLATRGPTDRCSLPAAESTSGWFCEPVQGPNR